MSKGSCYTGMTSLTLLEECWRWLTQRGSLQANGKWSNNRPALLLAEANRWREAHHRKRRRPAGWTDLISKSQAIEELGGFALEVKALPLRVSACMLEDEMQQLLSEEFPFGVRLHRHVAMGKKLEERWNSSIVFISLLPHTAPMEMNKASESRPGEMLPSHIYCGKDKTKLLVNW